MLTAASTFCMQLAYIASGGGAGGGGECVEDKGNEGKEMGCVVGIDGEEKYRREGDRGK